MSQVSALIKQTLEESFPPLWVAGEVSNLRRPQSGHLYFDLKDEASVLHAVMWNSSATRLRFEVEDGQELMCFGELDVYPPQGKYQLCVRQAQPRGEGALQLAFRQLQQRLEADGLFDRAHKKPLPPLPRRIAAITSPSGAAIRDFLQVLGRRWPGTDVLLIPASVQGDAAAGEIAAALATANNLPELPDVIFVGRGGGSLEDLWCFNEEIVVRAIHASRVPVICGVGHEIDTTLSCLAADVRAPTPSAAAELLVPSWEEVARDLDELKCRLAAAFSSQIAALRARLDALAERRALRTPLQPIHDASQQLDELEARFARAARQRLSAAGDKLAHLAGRLQSLSPLAVLSRGYSLTWRSRDGKLLNAAGDVQPGDQIITRLDAGEIASRVESVTSQPQPNEEKNR